MMHMFYSTYVGKIAEICKVGAKWITIKTVPVLYIDIVNQRLIFRDVNLSHSVICYSRNAS